MAYSLAPTPLNLQKVDSWIEQARAGSPTFKMDVREGGTRRLTKTELGNLRVLESHPSSHRATLDGIVHGLVRERDRIARQLQNSEVRTERTISDA